MAYKTQIMTFEIDNQAYGINILSLDEIIPMLEIKPIPQGPDFLEGVINLRGTIIPVVDVKKQFGQQRSAYSLESRIIIAGFHSRKVGFIVDGVREIKELEQEMIQTSVIAPEHARFIDGIVKLKNGAMVQMIAIDKILNPEALRQLTQVVS